MQFDKSTVIQGMKMVMPPVDKGRTADINLSISLCLDDLSMKLQSVGVMKSYTESLSADTRTVTLEGDAIDLRDVYAIKYGTGSEQKVLEYKDPAVFLRTYDDPSATADVPSYWTILVASGGYPTVKFNCPTSEADTLTVYYFPDMTPDNMFMARSAAAIVEGALAYFYDIADRGAAHYERYKELVKHMRASDTFTPKETKRIEMSIEDKNIRSTLTTIANRRS